MAQQQGKGAQYIEGKRAVVEALRSEMPLTRIMVADNLKRDSLLTDIERKARRFDVPVQPVPRKKLDELSDHGSHQGIMAQAAPFRYVGVRDITDAAERYAAEHGGRALVILLDHITDAGNLGAVARSADAVGASGIVIPSKRSVGVGAATYKSSAGAIAHVPVAQVANLTAAIERLKKEGFWVAAASEQAEGPIWKSNLKGKMALVMGNENEGVSRVVLEACDFAVALPMEGHVGSLNVAQAATACMYEWLRQNAG